MVRYKAWTENREKSSQCPKISFEKPPKSLKNQFPRPNMAPCKQNMKKLGVTQDFCTALYI